MALMFMTLMFFCTFIVLFIVPAVLTYKGQNTDFFSNHDGGLFPGSQNNPASTGNSGGSTHGPQDVVSSTQFPDYFPTYSPDSVKSKSVQNAQGSGSSGSSLGLFDAMSGGAGAASSSNAASKGQFNLMDINTWDSIPAAFFQPSASAVDGESKKSPAGQGPAWKNTALSYSEAGAEPALSWDYSSAGLGSGAEFGSGGTQDVFLPLADHSPGSVIADQPVMVSDWSAPPVSKDTAKYREEPTSRPSFRRFSDGESMARAILSGAVKKWEWTYSTTLGAGLSSNKGDRNDQSVTCCQRLPYICGVDGMCVIGIDECKDFCVCAANPQMPHCIKIIPVIKRTMAALEKKIMAKIAKELNMTTTPSSMVGELTRQVPQNYMRPKIAETQNYEEPSWVVGRYPTRVSPTQRPMQTRITAATRKPASALFQPLESPQQDWSYFVNNGHASQFPSSQNQRSSSNKPTPLPAGTPRPINGQAYQETATLSINKSTFRVGATPAPAAAKTVINPSRPISKTAPLLSTRIKDNTNRLAVLSSTSKTKTPTALPFKPEVQAAPAQSSIGISKLPFTVDRDAVRPSKRTFLTPTSLTQSSKSTNFPGISSSSSNIPNMSSSNVFYTTTPTINRVAASDGQSTTIDTILNKTTRVMTSGRLNGYNTTSSNKTKIRRINTAPKTAAKLNGVSTNNRLDKPSFAGNGNKTASTLEQADKTRTVGHNNRTSGTSKQAEMTMTVGPSNKTASAVEQAERIRTAGRSNKTPSTDEQVEKARTTDPSNKSPSTDEQAEKARTAGPSNKTPSTDEQAEKATTTGPSNKTPSTDEQAKKARIAGPSKKTPSTDEQAEKARTAGPSNKTPSTDEQAEKTKTAGPSTKTPSTDEQAEKARTAGPSTKTPSTDEQAEKARTAGPSNKTPSTDEQTEKARTAGPSNKTPSTDEQTEKARTAGPSNKTPSIVQEAERTREVGSSKKSSIDEQAEKTRTSDVSNKTASTVEHIERSGTAGSSNKTSSIDDHREKTRTADTSNKTANVNTPFSTKVTSWRNDDTEGLGTNNQMDDKRRFRTTPSVRTINDIKLELRSGDILSITEVDELKDNNNSNSVPPIRSSITSRANTTYDSRLINNSSYTRVNDSSNTTSKEGLLETIRGSTQRHHHFNKGFKTVTPSRATTTMASTTSLLLSKQSTTIPTTNYYDDASSSKYVEPTNGSSPHVKGIATSTKPSVSRIFPKQFPTSLTGLLLDQPHSTQSPNSSNKYLTMNFSWKMNMHPHLLNISTDSKPSSNKTGMGITEPQNRTILHPLTSTPENYTAMTILNTSDLNGTKGRESTMTTNTMLQKLVLEPSSIPLPSADLNLNTTPSADLNLNTTTSANQHLNTTPSNGDHTNTWHMEGVAKFSNGKYSLKNNETDRTVIKQNISDLSPDQNKTLLKGNNRSATSTTGSDHAKNIRVNSTPHYSGELLRCSDDCVNNGGVCVVGDDAWARCVIVTETCDQFTCINGLCVSADGLQLCECFPGWAGTSCEQPCSIECGERSFCGQDGDTDNMTCTCRWKYTGKRCEKDLKIIPRNFEVAVPISGLDTWEVAVVAVISAVILGLMCVLSPYWLWKKQWLPLRRLIFFFQPYEDNDDNEFDAFVSYMSTPRDERFVFRHLYPKLERDLDFRLCLHLRDISPGESMSSNLIRAVESSRRIILILSPNYVTSEWSKPEYQKLQTEMLKVRNKIIPIILEDISAIPDLDNALKIITGTANCLKWPGEEKSSASSQVIKFWKILELAMPKRIFPYNNTGSHSCTVPVSSSRTSFNSIAYSLTEADIRTSSILRNGSAGSDSGNSSEKTASFDQLKRSSLGKLRFPEVSWSNLRANSIISVTPPLESRSISSGSDDTGIEMSARSSVASSDENVFIKPPLFGSHVDRGILKGGASHFITNLQLQEIETKERLSPGSGGHVVDIHESGQKTGGSIIPARSKNLSFHI